MPKQTSTNPFGDNGDQKQPSAIDVSRPTLPNLEEIPAKSGASIPESKTTGSNLFSKTSENNKPESYFKYLNGNNSSSNMPVSHDATNNSSDLKVYSLEKNEEIKTDLPVASSNKVIEKLPPLPGEINIQEESNIVVNRNQGVKKNIVVEVPIEKENAITLIQEEELKKKAELSDFENKKNSKPKKGKIITIIALSIVGAILLILITIPILSALGTTRDNAFSGLALSLPVDNLPFFNIFAKNPKLMVADIFNKSLSGDSDTKSETNKLTSTIKLSRVKDNQISSTTLNLNVNNKSNSDGSSNLKLNIGGEASFNGNSVSIDPATLGLETLSLSSSEYFVKYSLNQEIRNLIFPSSYYSSLNQLLKKYSDKYIKFSSSSKALLPDDPNFFKAKNTSPTTQFDASLIDQAVFSEEITPKFKAFISKELVNANNAIDVVNEGRVKVQGVDSIKLRLKYDKTKFKTFQNQFFTDFSGFIYENRTPFAKLYCASLLRLFGSSSVKTSDIESCAETMTKSITKEYITSQLEEFKYFDINNVVIYVNAENNDLTKITLNFSIDMATYIKDQEAKGTLSNNVNLATNYSTIEINLDYEILKSAKSISITAPTDSTPYDDFITDIGKMAKSMIMIQSL
ncbi:MAG: hypothetical protein WCK31_00385 [bacterium]